MTDSTPSISVVIPVRNGELYLAEAIESVLAQNHPDLQIVLVDDGSTDGSAGIARSFRDVEYVYQSNQGPAVARNTGLEMSRGEIIGFLDADDVWSRDKLEIQLSLLAANPDVNIVQGFLQFFWSTDGVASKDKYRSFGDPFEAPSLGTALIRKQVFGQIGMMDSTQLYCDDVDWYLRVKEAGVSTLVHTDVVYFYRRHEGNITNDHDLNRQYMVRAVKKALDRRRLGPRDSAERSAGDQEAGLHAARRPDCIE